MTNSLHSGSDRPAAVVPVAEQSQAYALYHPAVQRWIYQRRWDRLRDAQERAAELIITGERDVIIASATASGKTEAALLPICSVLAHKQDLGVGAGVTVLYVSPLKALGTDITRTLLVPLEEIGTGIRVGQRTGDTTRKERAAMVKKPPHILVTTPESLALCLAAPR